MNYIQYGKKLLQKKIKQDTEKGMTQQFYLVAIAFKGNKPVGIGFNNTQKTHPAQFRSAKSMNKQVYPNGNMAKYPHAEILAIDNATKKGEQFDHLVVVRLKADGSLGMAKPCSICMNKILKYKIKGITYSLDE